jgi:uncharacterized protein (PEP-CTERM system associated)
MALSFNYDINATDVVGLRTPGDFTQSANTAVVSLSATHRITPKLFGTAVGTYQNSEYNGGIANTEHDNYYLLGLSLEYRFNPNFSARAGYNYDNLQSDLPGRTFTRNRVFIGLTASY